MDTDIPQEQKAATKNLFPIFQKNYKPPVNPLKSLQIDLLEVTHSPKRQRRSLLGKSESHGLNQMVLDAGQKEVGPRICKDCGLLFSPGDAQDEEEHRKAHHRLQNLFTITLWKDANVLHSFVDGGNVILVDWSKKETGALSRLKDFTLWVDSEVGGGGEGSKVKSRLFLYVLPTKRKNQVRILGSVTMEIIEPNAVIAYKIGSGSSVVHPITADKEDESGPEAVNIRVGLTRLWTDQNYRRKSIASRLVDMVRFHSGIPGCIISRDQLGILEPSEDGKVFFRNYSGGEGGIYTYKTSITN